MQVQRWLEPAGENRPVPPAHVWPERVEWLMCAADPGYFTGRYGWIYNATAHRWLPFTLWPAQVAVMDSLHHERLLVILKARQLGITWLCLAYALWMVQFEAPATVLLFSRREAEAVDLLGRLAAMYGRLPAWLQARKVQKRTATIWELSNGSRVLAFSTGGARSYTGSLALVDEADYVPELGSFLNAVKPTVDAGGKLLLVSTADKRRPVSPFKNLYRAAVTSTIECGGDYQAIFLPWHAHPGRSREWYERTRAEMFAQRGTHDDFYAEYPATAEEALAPEQLDRRVPYDWLQAVMELRPPIEHAPHLALPGLAVYELPRPGRRYVVGADPAEGNPNSDDSAACVVDAETWAEVATLVGKLEPGAFAHLLDTLATYYGQADILVERNNHGHSVIRALQEHSQVRVLAGHDDRPGWLSNLKGKPLLYDAVAEAVREEACRIRSGETASQLASIEASTLRAPQGLPDDRADSFALAIAALARGSGSTQPSTAVRPRDPLADIDSRGW